MDVGLGVNVDVVEEVRRRNSNVDKYKDTEEEQKDVKDLTQLDNITLDNGWTSFTLMLMYILMALAIIQFIFNSVRLPHFPFQIRALLYFCRLCACGTESLFL